MKRLVTVSLVVLAAVSLTGCISRRPDVTVVVEPSKLDDLNSRYVSAPGSEFSVRLPTDLTVMKDVDEGGAQLYSVIRIGGDNRAKFMFVESTTNSVDVAIGLLDSVEGVTIVSREQVIKAGYEATKAVAHLSARPKEEVPYYFLRANDRTYVFSLPQGAYWQYFEAVVNSFQRN